MIRIGIIFFLILLLVSCANIQAPSGGPADTTPPKVVEYTPKNHTTNYSGSITILFDKYMDRNKVIENLSILPETKFNAEWTGKELTLNFPDKLLDNTTYSINFGTDFSDYLGNKPESSFNIVFSSGSVIDTGFVKGRILNDKPAGAFVFLYKIDGRQIDTLNPATTKPDYKTQIGTNGDFTIPALKDGKYRIFVIRDEFKNGLYDAQDSYSTYIKDLELKEGKTNFVKMMYGAPKDNFSPEISSINVPYSDRLTVKFSEQIIDSSLNKDLIFITDTNETKIIKIKSIFPGLTVNNSYELILESRPDTSKIWKLSFGKDTSKLPFDSSGNILKFKESALKFKPVERIDTSNIFLTKMPFRDSAASIPVDVVFDYQFSSSVDKANSVFSFKLMEQESNKEVKTSVIPSKDNEFRFKADSALKDNTKYIAYAAFKKLAPFQGKSQIDTTYIINFTSEDRRNTGTISGKFIPLENFCQSNIYLIFRTQTKKYITRLDSNNNFSFEFLPAMEYDVEAFCDINGNGEYDYGNPFPFKFAEPFYQHNIKVNIKPRWAVENFIIKQTEYADK